MTVIVPLEIEELHLQISGRPEERAGEGDIVAIPEVWGLHHRYERRAA